MIGRMLYLCKRQEGKQSLNRDEGRKIVANELRCDWVEKNVYVYPLHERIVATRMKDDYERFKKLPQDEKCSAKPKSDDWYRDAFRFNDILTLRCKDETNGRELLCEDNT